MESDYLIEKELLLKIGKKRGIHNRGFIEKDYMQDLFLYHLYKKTNLMVLKGGTLLYKFYNLPRFSEDLDFSPLKKFNTKKLISETASAINATVKNVKKTKNSTLTKLEFEGILTQRNTLRIDLNNENEVFGFEVKHFVPDYIDVPPFSLRALELKEALAEKIHSILSRNKARDLFDLFFLLRFVEPEHSLIEKKLGLFKMSFDFTEFEHRVDEIKDTWEKELKPFVLTELPSFNMARDFVLQKMKKQ